MDTVYITSLLQNILNQEFKDSEKRKIVTYADRLNCACVYCGDSTKNRRMKRMNLYFGKLFIICFNCGKKTNIDKFAKDFKFRLDPDKKMEFIEHLSSNVSYKDAEDDFLDTEFDKLIDMSDVERIFNDNNHVITNFNTITKNGEIYNYLVNRGIDDSLHKNIYEGKFWVNSEKYEPIIILLNRRGNKIIGLQVRNIKEGKRRIFKIYNFETLYKWVHNVEEITDITLNQIVIYNKISYYFNILNVNFEKKVTIFEGYLDSLFFPNSIGVVGTNTDMRLLESNNLDIQYFFDNDKAGYEKSDEKIKKGYPVFLWKKLFEDVVSKKKSEDPYKLMYRVSKIKDLNKLSELVKNPYKKLNLQDFFSKDLMDIKWLPKKEKRVYRGFTASSYSKP
jgi:hypothetical protein